MEDKLRDAALAVSSAEGEKVYEELLTALAATLGVEFALISVYVEPRRTSLRTLATLIDGRIAKNFEYPIAGTPCERAIGRAFGIYPERAREQFPGDGMMHEQGIESYAASTLTDARGEAIGVVTVMSRRPLANQALVEAMLKIFATRINAEIERRRSEANYRAIFDATEDAIFIHDFASGAILDANPKATEMYGYTREEFRRLTAASFCAREHPYTLEEVTRLFGEAKRGRVMRFEWRSIHKNGNPIWEEVTLKRVDIDGTPFVLAIAREIGERRKTEQALRAREAQYRAMFDAAADALVLRDADFRIVDVNQAYVAMSGNAREEVIGQARLTFQKPEERRRILELHARALAGEPVQFESPAVRRDGRTVQLELRGVPIQHDGRPHVLYVGRDVTERKAASERLAASEEQYRAIFQAATDALVLRDADFRIVDVNQAYVAMSGNAREEVIGQDGLTLRAPEWNEDRREVHARALAGEHVQLESEAVRRDGSRFLLEVHAVPMAYKGKPHVLYIGRNITERKAAEERLRASEEQYRAIFNATDEALVLRDAAFRIVDVNRAYEQMSGYTRAEVIHSDGLTFSSPDNLAERLAQHRRALAGEQVSFEVQGRSKDGRAFTVEVRLVPIQYRGEPHVLQIGQDVTARRAADAERAQLEAQLRQSQKMEAIGHLTGGIAHDFNNILQGILGNLTLAAERQAELGDARLGKYLERAQHSAQRARELIGQMLTFSRGQRGARRPVSLPELVRDAAKLLRSTLPSTIELRMSMAASVPELELDAVQIEQVVLNLCINARDAMRGSGAIRIGLGAPAAYRAVCASCRQKVDGRFVELQVRDNGPGIPQEVMDRMFEPFFSTKEVGRGSGMGLSLAHGIVHEHGGHILVDSLLGERTKFRVLLPVPEAGAPGLRSAGGPAGQASPARTRLAGRVLVVDDELAIREFMADLLGGWGLEVAVLADGAEARAAIAAEPGRYDLLITDQTMPHLTGLALAREVSVLCPGMPVILYTGYAEDLSPQELRAAGVRELVRKPIEPAHFFPLLAAHLAAR
jgi:PAS domain S-box-containing protein